MRHEHQFFVFGCTRMSHMGYSKFRKISHHHHHHSSSSSSNCTRGFKLKYPKRFSVQRLRARFFYLFRFLSRWRSSYGQAIQSLKRGMSRNSSSNSSSSSSGRDFMIKRSGSSKRGLMMDNHQYRFASLGRSNSFYAEAIADCLEFIKRSSISVEQKQLSPR